MSGKTQTRVPDRSPVVRPDADTAILNNTIIVVPERVAPQPVSSRLHHLDALRGLLMMLGVVLHAALIYSPKAHWIIGDPERSPEFGDIYRFIHYFRMPAFFVIAGFLCVPSLNKGVGTYLRDRSRRLILPLAATALLLNSIQTLLVSGPEGFWQAYSGGRWVSHLWFLLDLLAFTLVAAGVWSLAPGLSRWKPPLLGGAIVFVLPLGSAGIRWACHHYLEPGLKIFGALNVNDLIYYLPFFLYGMLERPGEDPARLRRLASTSVVLLLGVLVLPTYRLPGERLYHEAAMAWSISILCIYLGLICLNRQSGVLRTLADASYTIFLFHQLIVIALGLALIRSGLPTGVKFGVVVTFAFLLSLAIHVYVIRPSQWLSLLFNGRKFRPTPRGESPEPRILEGRIRFDMASKTQGPADARQAHAGRRDG